MEEAKSPGIEMIYKLEGLAPLIRDPPPTKPFIYEAKESSLVPEGFLTAQFLQKL